MTNKKRKKVIGDPKSFRGEFSFVNKDASNIDSKDHNAAVSWHVMNRYERWKKQEEAKKLRSSAHLPAPPQLLAPGTSGTSTEDDLGTVTYPPSPWQVENIEQSMLNASSPSPAHAWFQSPSYLQGTDDYPFPLTVGTFSGSDQLSQQDVLQESTTFPPLVNRVLSYAYGLVIPTTWPNECGRAKWTYEISRTWEDIAAIKHDSCYASALLCFYATLMAAATNNKDIASQACFFQVQAMTELRRKLSIISQGSDQMTLRAILKLFSAETALDNTAAARVHLKMLRTFVGTKGGIIMLDSWLRENILATDCYFALKYETRPLFPVNEWTPGPLSQPWKIRLAQTALSDEHSSSIDTGIEHVNLRGVIADLRELCRIEQYINDHDLAAEDHLLRWRLLRRYDCISRLADHQLSVKIYPHLYERPRLQLAVCAAVGLMAAMTLGSPEPVRTGLKTLKELHTKVLEARAEFNRSIEANTGDAVEVINRVILWVLYAGRLAEQVLPVPGESIWFLDEHETLAMELGLPDVEKQRNLFRNFLFSLRLETEIQMQRPRRTSESRKGVYEACGMSWRAPLEQVAQGLVMMGDSPTNEKGKERSW